MTNFILALRTMLAVIPEILNLLKAIELPGFGSEKLSAVIQIVMAALGALPEELKGIIDNSKFGAFVEKVVTILVKFLNITKVFVRSTPDQ